MSAIVPGRRKATRTAVFSPDGTSALTAISTFVLMGAGADESVPAKKAVLRFAHDQSDETQFGDR